MKTARILTLAASLALAHVAVAQGDASESLTFKLEQQPLAEALSAFSKQTGLQVIQRDEDVSTEGLMAPRLYGKLTPREALRQLLANTGLKYEFINDRTVRITSTVPAAGVEAEGGRAVEIQMARVDQNSTAMRKVEEPPSQESNTTPATADDKLQEIIVTAQKREESLQDVPISMTVLSGAELDRSTAQGMTEVLSRVPGVAVNESIQSGGTQLSVRGVTASDPLFAGAGPIAFYLDSAPFGFARSAIVPDPNVFDLERVEVLRGPQGTLYGAGGQGGVVRVLTNNANPDRWEFKARTSTSATEDGGDNYRGDMAINVPLVATIGESQTPLAVRAVVSYNDLSGWVDAPNRKDINDAELLSYRFKVFAQPTENLTVGLSAWRSEGEYGAPSVSDDNDEIDRVMPEWMDTLLSVYSVTLDYELPLFSVSSASSYLKYSNDSIFDFRALALTTDLGAESFSQEILFNSTLEGPWQWTAGLFYRDAEDTLDQALVFYPATVAPFPKLLDTSESYAVFGEVSRSLLNNRLKLTAGLRYFSDDGATVGENRFSDTYDALTPRLVLAWTPDADLSTYVSYAQGFRSGVHQSEFVTNLAPDFPPAQPDKLHNYEFGAKGRLFGGILSYETAVYYIDWQDIQQILGVPYVAAPGADPISVNGVVNGSSASGIGYDLALTLNPVRGLELGTTFSWNQIEFDADVFSLGELLFEKGDRLEISPEYTAGAFAEYSFPIGAGFTGRLSGSVNYTSPLNTSTIEGATFVTKSILVSRAGLAVESPDRWSAILFVDNLGDERDARVMDPFDPTRSSRIRPRTYGIQLTYSY